MAKESHSHQLRALGLRSGLVIAFALVYIHQPPEHCPTALSRLDLLHALCQGTICIDTWHDNTPDKAEYRGHFYSDKAPGTVALSLLPFATGQVVLKAAGVPLESDAGWLLSSWIACAGSIGVVTSLGAIAMCTWLSRQVTPKAALITTMGVFLGAAPLPYATMMFSHALVVGLIAIALWAIVSSNVSAPSPQEGRAVCEAQPCPTEDRQSAEASSTMKWLAARRWDMLAGFACGWALSSEFTAGLVVMGLLLWLVRRGWQRAVAFCLAAVGPLLLIPAYSWICFGTPLILPYSLNASFPDMQSGLYAIKWPNSDIAVRLLAGPTRGLLFWSPFLVLAVYGYWRLIHENMGTFSLTYAVPILQVIVISGRVWDWEAGPTLGPRYLAPILPLLALPCCLGVVRYPRLAVVLVGYSSLITTLATLTDAAPSSVIFNPLLKLHVELLLKGEFAPNLGTLLGLTPLVSVAVFYAILLAGVWWVWRFCKRMERS